MPIKNVILTIDPYDTSTWEYHDVENVAEFLMSRYGEWPETARIYHDNISEQTDVTPYNESDIDKLLSLEGRFYVVVYPAGPLAIIIGVVALLAVAALFFLAPKPQASAAVSRVESANSGPRNRQSSNNELSDRKNQARIKGRIPDIYGTVRSTPDLIAAPYTIFENHLEKEIANMCIGRGSYDVEDIRDDTTPVDAIAGTSVAIYAPGTTANSGDAPQLQIGDPSTEGLREVKRITAVNGQTLRPPNDVYVNGASNIYFASPNEIRSTDSGMNFEDKFEPGDVINVTNASVLATLSPGPGTEVRNFAGSYTISSLDADTIVLSSPSTINSAWTGFTTTVAGSVNLSVTGPRWVGPFIVEGDVINEMRTNIVAANGLYKDNGTQYRTDIQFEIEITPVNQSGVPVSASEFFQGTVEGSAVISTTRALTMDMTPVVSNNRYRIRARRITAKDTSFNGQVVDEIKWRDFYLMRDVGDIELGDVTTVHSVTYATSGALAIKERKLNLLATRLLPQRVSGSTFTTELYPTNSAADIFSAICLDPFIGNRSVGEIDFDNIYDTMDEVATYFGTTSCAQFNHTIDATNMSFEETAFVIADAAFCTPYRRGSQIKIYFERQTSDSVILFNHRNKIPGTETRTIRFGVDNDNDGVEYTYTSPKDDAVVTFYIPEDQSAVNPKKVESIGVRSLVCAHIQAYRIWNKLRYQNILSEFDATQEADLLIPNERILVADNTRPDIQDGEVLLQNGLELILSQDVTFQAGVDYVIFLQLADATVQSIPITAGTAPDKVILQNAPALPLVTANDRHHTTYLIVGDNNRSHVPFLVNEKQPKENLTVTIRAANYDDRFYQNDTDYINELVTEEPAGPTYDGPFIIHVTESISNLNFREYCDARGYEDAVGDVTIVVDEECWPYSENPSLPAATIGIFPADSVVNIQLNADIIGAGGAGGAGGDMAIPTYHGANGGNGGDGLDATMVSGFTVNIDGTGRSIFAGGSGGGGGGGGASLIQNGDPEAPMDIPNDSGGGGGGGGRGYLGGAGGTGGIAPISGNNGANGGPGIHGSGAGAGGAGGADPNPGGPNGGGAGGNGGDHGAAGSAGAGGNFNGTFTYTPGSGGASGYAVKGYANITWTVLPTIVGPTT